MTDRIVDPSYLTYFDNAAIDAKKELKKNGNLKPLVIILKKNGGRLVKASLPYSFGNDNEKEQMFRAISGTIREIKADAYITVTEVFTKKEEFEPGGDKEARERAKEWVKTHKIADLPFYERGEAIVVSLVHRSGVCKVKIYPFKKNELGDIIIEDAVGNGEEPTATEGRMVGFFKD